MESLSEQLPFATIDNDQLYAVLNTSFILINVNKFSNLQFDPFTVDDNKYNNNLEVNEFYTRTRSLNLPKTEYIPLNDMSLMCNNSLSILNMNIRSIPRNFQVMTDEILHISPVKFDVIGLTETRLDSHLCSLYQIPGYYMYSNPRNTHGGGVTIYMSSNLDSAIQNELTISESFIETVSVEVKILSKQCLFVCIYRPPNSSFVNF